MKKVILSAAMFVASMSANFAQTYQNDYQKIIGLDKEGMKNYTLCETKDNGFAMVSFIEAGTSLEQNRIQIFKTDANFKVLQTQRFEFNPSGQFGTQITPFDIYETEDNNFIISGGIMNESDQQNSGGFLLSIKNIKNQMFEMDWMQIYPNDDPNGEMRIQDIRRVVKLDDGYIALGTGRDAGRMGIIIKTDLKGNIKWSKHVYDTEHGEYRNSVMRDIVRINGKEVVIVGSVNNLPYDDSDIVVVHLTTDGEIISNIIYENELEPKDQEFTYHEDVFAVEYNRKKNEIIVAGTNLKKVKGSCVTAEYKEILTFGIDLKTANVNWSTRHDIGADKTYQRESYFCSDIDFGEEGFAVSGSVKNSLFGKVDNFNGFILRLNEKAMSTDIRFYGAHNQEYLQRIYSRGNCYVAGGMFNKDGNNLNWMIESFNSVKSDCSSNRSEAKSVEYPLRYKKGASRKVVVKANPTSIKTVKSPYFESVICPKILTKKTFEQVNESKKTFEKL
ncbi:MAG: hypothetical protein GQ574_02015 [Crocinitomix sp.]|nr:hypothetical protein [Crocinitomix sp.]